MKNKIVMVLLLILAVGGVGGYAYYNSVQKEKARLEAIRIEEEAKQALVKEWEAVVYPGVTVSGVDMEGLSRDELEAKLKSEVIEKVMSKTMNVTVEDKTYPFDYANLNLTFDIDEITDEVIDFGKDMEFENKVAYLRNPEGKEITIDFAHDPAYVEEFVSLVLTESNQDAKDASVKIVDGKITIEESQNGQKVDAEKLKSDLIAAITPSLEPNETLTAKVEIAEPKVKTEMLSKINGVLATYSTGYASSAAGRKYNVALAASKVNGTVLMPGEIISYNATLGGVNAANGYKEAGVYVGNKVEQGIGGGICQISSTLYQTSVRAGLGVVERRNHSMPVAYLPVGLDATVYDPYTDLKLQNNYSSPIYFYAHGNGSKATITIYGNVDEMDGKSYDFATEVYSKTEPKVEYINDATMNVGTEVIEQQPVTGYKVRVYLKTIKDGKVIETKQISNDTYKTVNKIVRRGTKPVPAAPADPVVETPAVVEPPVVETPVDGTEGEGGV